MIPGIPMGLIKEGCGCPNPGFYKPDTTYYQGSEEGSNSEVPDIGRKLRLPCGGVWLVAPNCLVYISYWADTYDNYSVALFHDKSRKEYHVLGLALKRYLFTIFSVKDLHLLPNKGVE